jgi:hypothetical protein
MTQYYNLAIRWNNKGASLLQIVETGRISVHDRPQYLCSGKWVAVVPKGSNKIQLMFKVSNIKGPQKVTLANGKKHNHGYVITATRKTIQRPKPSVPLLRNYLPVIGAFGYFNKVTMEPVLVGEAHRAPRKDPPNKKIEISGIDFERYTPGYPDMPHGDEEARLVKRYAEWMGQSVHFGLNGLNGSRLSVDLFDLTHWQLIEAKVATNRETIRMAIGQLRDYKRYFDRSPSLAVLLPSRPSNDCVELLIDNHISVIWEKSEGSFTIKQWRGK